MESRRRLVAKRRVRLWKPIAEWNEKRERRNISAGGGSRGLGNDIPQGLIYFILRSICQFLFSDVIIIKNRKKSKKIVEQC